MESSFPSNTAILIVDDAESLRVFLKQILGDLGYISVYEASNGKEALSKLGELSVQGIEVQLLIVDWHMPIMSGIDLLLEMKNQEKYRNIPFLMIATESETANIIKAIVLGVSDFILKPFDLTILRTKLASIWRRAQAPRV